MATGTSPSASVLTCGRIANGNGELLSYHSGLPMDCNDCDGGKCGGVTVRTKGRL